MPAALCPHFTGYVGSNYAYNNHLGPEPVAATATTTPQITLTGEPTLDEAYDWLLEHGLLRKGETEEAILRRYIALSKCQFGEKVSRSSKVRFLR